MLNRFVESTNAFSFFLRERDGRRALTCARHSHDQLVMKRHASTRGQTGPQIHSQHAVLLLVPLQILHILRSYARAATGTARGRKKEDVPLQFSSIFSLFAGLPPRAPHMPPARPPHAPALRSLNLYRSRSRPRGVRTT